MERDQSVHFVGISLDFSGLYLANCTGVNKKLNKFYSVYLPIWGILILSVGLKEEISILFITTLNS